jgi:hypothetical protein
MKKLGIILVIVITGLGLMGTGYALWTQSLSITSHVSTGNLAATINVNGTPTASASYATIVKDTTNSTSTSLVLTISNAAPAVISFQSTTITGITGSGATSSDLTVSTPSISPSTIPATTGNTATGSFTITVNSTAPNNSGGNSYTVNVPITASQP